MRCKCTVQPKFSYLVQRSTVRHDLDFSFSEKATGTLPVSNSSDSLMCPKNASVYNNSKSLHPSTTLTILESATGSENDILQKMSLTEDRGPSPAPIDEPGRFARIWNKKTVPLYLLILFPVICMRSVTFFTKFNCLGKSQLIQIAISNFSYNSNESINWIQQLNSWLTTLAIFITYIFE